MHDKRLAIQDCYEDDFAHCYGCGRLNTQGLQIKSYHEGDETICRILPAAYYTGGKSDILYGGLIASLIDCHGAGTAAAAKAEAEGIRLAPGKVPRFVTASLKVDYLAPTPVGVELELRGRTTDINGRKVTVTVTLSANGSVCAKGELLMIQIKEKH